MFVEAGQAQISYSLFLVFYIFHSFHFMDIKFIHEFQVLSVLWSRVDVELRRKVEDISFDGGPQQILNNKIYI